MAMKIMPKTIVGQLHSLNKGACDWGWQGLVAYGCQNCVVVVDPVTVQVAQVLDRHRGYVVKVKWARENYRHDLASPYSLRLASADYNGKILIWDVASGVVGAECSEGSKPVAEMEWISMQDISHDLLVALHPPSTLVLWNTENGSKLWKKTYGEVLQSFSFDPFDPSRLAFLGQDCVLFVDDFSLSKVPLSNGKKFYLSSPSNQATGSISHSSSYDKLSDKRASKSAIRRMSGILVGEGKRNQDEEPSSMSECLELAYHKACRHHLILVYAKEVLVLDLDIKQTVSIIPTERTGSPFMQVIPVRQRDVLICLHETGSLSVKARRWQMQTSPAMQSMADDGGSPSSGFDIYYDHRCQSDPLRVTMHNRVYGAACCPVSENKVVLVMSNGKLLIWELNTVEVDSVNKCLEVSPLYTPGTGGDRPSGDVVHSVAEGHRLNLGSTLLPPKLALCDLISSHMPTIETQSVEKHGGILKFIMVGLLSGLAAPPVVIRMCPPLTTKNFSSYQPLMAVGSNTGIVQVYNLSSGQLAREFGVHSCVVRGIEWVSLRGFLSFAYPTMITNSNLVKNELMLTDIDTGRSTQLRSNTEEESPIEMIRVSYLKQYFIIVFKDKPFEVWDLRSHTLLRQMPKNFPTVTAIEWSPSHNIKSLKKKVAQPETNGTDGNLASSSAPGSSLLDLASTTPSSTTPTTDSSGEGKLVVVSVREHFVFTDGNGLLYHYIVDGNLIKEGSKIPPDASMGSITCIAWKSETLVLSDVDGNINLWDLKARVSRTVPTARGWIRKIKFAPGRGNMKLLILFNDGIDVWDAKDVERVTSVKCPKDRAKVVDVDWAASDRPVLACADGCLHIMDLMCISGCSTMEDSQLLDPMFCPHMLPAKASFVLKCLLQHQPWREKYSLDPEELEATAEVSPLVTDQIYLLDGCLRSFLIQCPFSTAQRCYLTAQLYGDEAEMTFWAVALHYLRAEKAEPSSRKINSASSKSMGDLFVPTTPGKESQDLLIFDDAQKQSTKEMPTEKISWAFVKDKSLEMCYDVICDNQTFRTYELRRVSLHDNKRVTNEHTRKCAENLILLDQADRAVQLLLETEPDSANYYVDSLRACLVASVRSSGASQSTIKLVATNLIANGRLSEGVQLLCLIDKGLDACRYLQTYDQWHQAAWLAKVTLDNSECSEVMKRWADHLASPQVDQKNRAMLVLLSLGQFTRVVELLYSQRYFDRAALFIEACREFGLLTVNDDIRGLVESVFLEYSRFLLSLGLTKACEYYCKQAGQKGQALLAELQS